MKPSLIGAIVVAIAPVLTIEPAQAISFTRTITFNEMGAPGFPTVTTTIAPPGGASIITYDVINNGTGALSADGTPDITIAAQASARGTAGSSGTPELEWQTTSSGRFTSNRGFTASAATNNPGTIQSTTTQVLFDSSLNITNLAATFSSLNTAGILWEYSVIGFLNPGGQPFSTAPAIGLYASATSFTGSPSVGWYVAADKGTVTNVGTNLAVEGINGPADGTLALTYALAGLTPGIQVGGLTWTTYTEDTRGKSNRSSSFTASLSDVTFTHTAAAVPTPALLPGLLATGLGIWRRRQNQV
jgi:hypothetical protein